MVEVAAIRVVVVDDHPVVRDGLRGMLAGTEFDVVVRRRTGWPGSS